MTGKTPVRSFTTRPLTRERAFLAYPLVRNALPETTLEVWTAFAEAFVGDGHSDPRRSILTVENESGVIIGLVAFHCLPDIVHGWVLMVSHLLAFELLDRRGVAEMIVQALEAEAGRLGCRAIHTCLPVVEGEQRPAWLVALLQSHGHHVESMSLCKRLAPT
ncbi:GNAT family N-acetyltransferase [Tistlia consotensis]|uniref:GNAT family N-acetyltransferase n=1 Tax=Tistlia consotensis TaxID=1321365 RepID=UPI00117F9329|nr:GNAT family N-acetyltransferase [Tistlia consotensis]